MTLIIAEAGVNHNGSEQLAFDLVDIAHRAGADIVKFQTFKAKNLVTKKAQQASYQVDNSGKKESQLSMLSRLELSHASHHNLIKYCKKIGIEFLSTAFDKESLDFLVSDLGLKRLKIPSGDLTNAPLLLDHARTGCDLIVSTGMATLSEVETALGVIAFGYTRSNACQPSISAFKEAYNSLEGSAALRDKVTLLHCTTEYPAPLAEINLTAIETLSKAFKLPTGYSDHSKGIHISIAAAARGAVLIEKHFTLDKDMEGPDHKASLNPSELKEMIEAIREIKLALGDGVKRPTLSETKNKVIARKSLVAIKAIQKGELFTEENLSTKRPGFGVSPYKYWEMLGTSAKKTLKEDEVLK